MEAAEITIRFDDSNKNTAYKIELTDEKEISLFLSRLIENNRNLSSVTILNNNDKKGQ